MSRRKKVWLVWTCWKCGRRHKNGIHGILDHVWWYRWTWKCDKCRKVNVITIEIKIRGEVGLKEFEIR